MSGLQHSQMVNPYNAPITKSQSSRRKSTTAKTVIAIVVRVTVIVLSVVPCLLGGMWLVGCLKYQPLYGPTSRSHHCDALVFLGSGLLVVFGPLLFFSTRSLLRIFKVDQTEE